MGFWEQWNYNIHMKSQEVCKWVFLLFDVFCLRVSDNFSVCFHLGVTLNLERMAWRLLAIMAEETDFSWWLEMVHWNWIWGVFFLCSNRVCVCVCVCWGGGALFYFCFCLFGVFFTKYEGCVRLHSFSVLLHALFIIALWTSHWSRFEHLIWETWAVV